MKIRKDFSAYMGILFLFFGSLIVCFMCALDYTQPEIYETLFFLPLSFVVFVIAYFNIIPQCKRNLVSSILLLLYFVRDVVSIFVMCIGDYKSVIIPHTRSDINSAIALMAVDKMVVFWIVAKETKNRCKNITEKKLLKWKPSIFATLSLSLLFCVLCVLWSQIPEISQFYTTLFDQGAASFETVFLNDIRSVGGIGRRFIEIFLILFSLMRIIFPAVIVSFMRQKFKSDNCGIWIGLAFVGMQFLFITSQTMDVVLSAVSGCLTILRLFPEKKKQLQSLFFVAGTVGLYFIVVGKMSETGGTFNSLSAMLQAYIPGVTNMAGIFKIDSIDRTTCFLNDLKTSLPFGEIQGHRTNDLFMIVNGVRGQIIPFTGEMYLLFGVIAPFIIAGIVKVAFFYYNKAISAVNIMDYSIYIYTSILFAISPVLYHDTILGQKYFCGCLIMIIISKVINIRRKE